MPLQITDGTIVGLIGMMGGALTYYFKRDIKRTDKQLAKQDLEIADQKKEMIKQKKEMIKQKKHTEECNEDRKSIKAAHERLKTRTSDVENTLKMTSHCDNGDCPNRALLKAASRHHLRSSS